MSQPAEITVEQVRHIARLARLTLDEAEQAAYTQELNAILGYARQLMAIDVSGVEPLTHAIETRNVWRDDTPGPVLGQARTLANAPLADQGFFRLPKVLGGDESS